MIVTDVVTRLASQASPDPFRIIGTAFDLAGLDGRALPQAPCCFVLPLSETAQPNRLAMNDFDQELSVRVGLVIVVRRLNSSTGAGAESALDSARDAARRALLGWMPASADTPMEFVQGRLLKLQDGLVWWQDEYLTISNISA